MQFKAILFDLGGTLLEYENRPWPELVRLGVANAFPMLQELHPALGKGEFSCDHIVEKITQAIQVHSKSPMSQDIYQVSRQALEESGITLSDKALDEFVTLYYWPTTQQVTLIDGALGVLGQLRRAGLALGIISNTLFPERFHWAELERFGLRPLLDFAIFSSTVGAKKPALEIFDMALRLAGAVPSEALFVGDRVDVDVQGARNAGMVAVWKYHLARRGEVDIEPDYIVVDLAELLPIIFR